MKNIRLVKLKNVMSTRVWMTFVLLFSCCLTACGHIEIDDTDSNKELSHYQAVFFEPESLEIKSEYALYVAKNKNRGLKEFDSLDENRGMIFIYDENVDHKFTMKGMKFNIDMIFLDRVSEANGDKQYKIIHIVKNAKAGEVAFGGSAKYNAVLEVPAHESNKDGLVLGDIMLFTGEPLIGTDLLHEGSGDSYVLKEVAGGVYEVTANSKSIIENSFQTAAKTLNSEEFKRRLLLRLSKRGWDRLIIEPEIAIKDIRVHEGKNIQVSLFVDSRVPGDARTSCGNASGGYINISINPNVLSKGEHYIAGTLAHELTHHIGNGYGDKPCYVDSGGITRFKGYMRKFIGGDQVVKRNRLTYNVGGLVCEMVAESQGIVNPKCPQG